MLFKCCKKVFIFHQVKTMLLFFTFLRVWSPAANRGQPVISYRTEYSKQLQIKQNNLKYIGQGLVLD